MIAMGRVIAPASRRRNEACEHCSPVAHDAQRGYFFRGAKAGLSWSTRLARADEVRERRDQLRHSDLSDADIELSIGAPVQEYSTWSTYPVGGIEGGRTITPSSRCGSGWGLRPGT